MPELPEVESVIRSLDNSSYSIKGRKIINVALLWKSVIVNRSPDDFISSLEGTTFVSLKRCGKYIILGLRNLDKTPSDSFLIVHLRMTGLLFRAESLSPPGLHTRMVVFLDDGNCLRFDDSRKFGKVWLVDDVKSVITGLGPDASSIDFAGFESRITGHRRQIKPLLLDQSFIAGIGNIYADEILFRAGIHPLSQTDSFSSDTIRQLHASIISVLTEAVEKNGANIKDTFKEGNFIVSVYGREGKPCIKCGASVSKIRVAQRGTHLCNNCQSSKDVL